jgi:hypothetical protein
VYIRHNITVYSRLLKVATLQYTVVSYRRRHYIYNVKITGLAQTLGQL